MHIKSTCFSAKRSAILLIAVTFFFIYGHFHHLSSEGSAVTVSPGLLHKHSMSYWSACLHSKQQSQDFFSLSQLYRRWAETSRGASEEPAPSFQPCRLKRHYLSLYVQGGIVNMMTPPLISSTHFLQSFYFSKCASILLWVSAWRLIDCPLTSATSYNTSKNI